MKESKKVILVAPGQALHVTPGENLGIGYLAAALRATGYQVDVIDAWLSGLMPSQIAERIAKHDGMLLVGFSSYPSNLETVSEVVGQLRKAEVSCPFVGGGYGPTFFPEEFFGCGLDYIVSKEGDIALPLLCDHLATGSPPLKDIENLSWVSAQGAEEANPIAMPPELDDLPFPARDTTPMSRSLKSPTNILSSQGCTSQCAYCCIGAYHRRGLGPHWRQRSLENFLDEVEHLVNNFAVTHFKIVDDSLLEPPRDLGWCTAFADGVAAQGLAGKVWFKPSMRAQYATDPVVRELKRAGVKSVSCGIENFSPVALARMHKTAGQMDNLEALRTFKRHGVFVEAGFIWFDDMTTLAELRENCDLMMKDDWMLTKAFSEMYAVTGTPFADRLKAEGKIDGRRAVLGNCPYRIGNEGAHTVYLALREHWDGPYGYLYDAATNPVKCFLEMSYGEYEAFLALYQEAHRKELLLLDRLIRTVDDGGEIVDALSVVSEDAEQREQWYSDFDRRLAGQYAASGLQYLMNKNPFVKELPVL